MVDFLQQGIALERLLANLRSGAGVQVVIGSETSIPELQDYSFVLGQYGRGDDAGGYLGVVGPIRMQYPRAVALVQYMTDVIADILHPY
jgi:heat-inducible transcriptional repressor